MKITTELTDYQVRYISAILSGKTVQNPELSELLLQGNDFENYTINDITNVLRPQVTKKEQKAKGITFTPLRLVRYMYENVLSDDVSMTDMLNSDIADLSAGNGAFFVGLFQVLKEHSEFSLRAFIEKHIYAYELEASNAAFLELIFKILVEYFGENSSHLNIHLTVGDTLKLWRSGTLDRKFDLIVGNPPYVKQQNLDETQRNFLLHSFDSIDSNYNLYYAFVELSAKLIGDEGRALLLVPNYLLKIKSAESLRRFLVDRNYFERIVDFQFSKLFAGIDTYSMILQLKLSSDVVQFKNLENLEESKQWTRVSASSLNTESINLVDEEEQQLIDIVKSQPNSLVISTGIATLKDKVYLIDEVHEDERGQLKFTNSIEDRSFDIEPDVVVPITKGSGASANALPELKYILYPYHIVNGSAFLIDESEMANSYPQAFAYLQASKNILASRSGSYGEDEWYRYGRSQALTRFDSKIVFPTNTDHPKFRFVKEGSLLFNGYAVYGIENCASSERLLRALTVVLNSSLTDRFMRLTSYYIGGGYLSYQKKYIEKFRIPELDAEDIEALINIGECGTDSRINKLVQKIYGIEITLMR